MRFRPWSAAVGAVLAVGLVTVPMPAFADEARDHQWYLSALRIPEAHAISQGDGVTVALIDSGVDAQHPDLVGNVLPGRNMTGADDNGWSDPTGHGTGTAAILAGHGHGTNGGEGILGIAPKAKILPITVPEGSLTQGKTYMSDAVTWAVEQGADIICITMSSGYDDAVSPVNRAVESGVMVVAAAGNRTVGSSDIVWPAADPSVVAVSATDQSGAFATDVSVHGPNMAAAAPGIDVPVPVDRTSYAYDIDGTSSSAPIVAGVFALAKAAFPNDSRTEWHQRVLANTIDKGDPGPDDYYGYGLIDPVGALTGGLKPLPAENKAGSTPSAQPSASKPGTPPAALDTGATGNTATVLVAVAVGIAVVAVLVAIGVVAARRRRRQGQPPPPPPPPGG